MSVITAVLGGSWQWLAGLAALVAALFASYVGGHKIGKTKERARADIAAARKESAQISAVAKQQQQNREEANRVQHTNNGLDDAAARDKLQQSNYRQS